MSDNATQVPPGLREINAVREALMTGTAKVSVYKAPTYSSREFFGRITDGVNEYGFICHEDPNSARSFGAGECNIGFVRYQRDTALALRAAIRALTA